MKKKEILFLFLLDILYGSWNSYYKEYEDVIIEDTEEYTVEKTKEYIKRIGEYTAPICGETPFTFNEIKKYLEKKILSKESINIGWGYYEYINGVEMNRIIKEYKLKPQEIEETLSEFKKLNK